MRLRNKIGRGRGWRRMGVEGLESRQLLTMAVAEYPVPSSPTAAPAGIVSGPGGLLWFTERTTRTVDNRVVPEGGIGAIDPTTKAIVEYPIVNAASDPGGIVWGPDGDLWFADFGTGSIGQFDPSTHAIVEYVTPTNSSGPLGVLAFGGKIWFTEYSAGQIGAIDPVSHGITEYHTGGAPTSLAPGADGNLYFIAGALGQFNPTTHATAFFPVTDPPPSTGPGLGPAVITSQIGTGPDGGLYFGTATPSTFGNYIGAYVHEIGPTRAFHNPPMGSLPGVTPGPTGGLAAGPDGKLYYTTGAYNISGPSTAQAVTAIASLDPATGTIAESEPFAGGGTLYPSIADGPDGHLWFTTGGAIGEATVIPADQSAISGTIVLADSNNQPLPRQLVFVDLNRDGTFDAGEPSALSGLDGSYTIAGAPVGTYAVAVENYPGDSSVAQSVVTTGGGLTSNVNLTVHTTSILLPITSGPAPFGVGNPNVITAEVTGLYTILLGRQPDAPGLAGWVGAIRGGMPSSSVVDAFLHSTAYYDRVVVSDYRAFAGRAPSQAETDAWASLLHAGYTEEHVAELMLTSNGFNSLHATDASFIQSLYNDLLGRQATDGEVAGWATYLAGSSRAVLVDLFVRSAPAEERAANGFIDTIWNARTNPTAVSNVVAALQGGSSLSSVAELFFDDPAYATYANKSVGVGPPPP